MTSQEASSEQQTELVVGSADDGTCTDAQGPGKYITQMPHPIKYLIAMVLHLLSWAVVIAFSFFPVPWILVIWLLLLVVAAIYIVILVIVGGCVLAAVMCCSCCRAGGEERPPRTEREEEKEEEEAAVTTPLLSVQSGASPQKTSADVRKLDVRTQKQKKGFVYLCSNVEFLSGLSMFLNFVFLSVMGAYIEDNEIEVPYFDVFRDAWVALPTTYVVGVIAFMICFPVLVAFEGVMETCQLRSGAEDVTNTYEMIVFKLLLYSRLGGSISEESTTKPQLEADDIEFLGEISKRKTGLVFHYALIAFILAFTCGLVSDQVAHALQVHRGVSIDDIWTWCSVIFTNACAGYVVVSALTNFMVDNLVLTEYFSCKQVSQCIDHSFTGMFSIIAYLRECFNYVQLK